MRLTVVVKLILLCVCGVAIIDGQTQLPCNDNSARKVDALVSRLITMGNSGRNFPETEQQVQPFCNETYLITKSVKSYAKNCMKNLAKQVTSVIMYTAETQLKNNVCKENAKRRPDLIDAGKCANRASRYLQKCMTNFLDALLGAQNGDDKLKIPHVCCQFEAIKDCIINQGKIVSICTEKRLQTINDFMTILAGDVTRLICTEFDETSDKCERLGKPANKRKNQTRSKSFLPPLVELLNSFPEA